MNLNIYERTRYQNIYRHIKNKNYVIIIPKPKTSISRIDGKKIYRIEDALKIRDNPKLRLQKQVEINYNGTFDEFWDKYIYFCKYKLKHDYNTYHKKEKLYKAYLQNKFKKKLPKIIDEDILKVLNDIDTTDKQKNEILKILRSFFNWCIDNEYLITSPVAKIKDYKVQKHKMKYWLPSNVQTFFTFINNYISNENIEPKQKEIAYRTKMLVLIEFSLGDRVGETRALRFSSINKNNSNVSIYHSIEYNPDAKDFLGTTKTYASQRDVDVSERFIIEVEKYKSYLLDKLGYNVSDDSLIFFNYSTNKPFSDITLRKHFYQFCDMANVPRIRMYDLRHTYVATMMAEGKELYLISERLGHTNFATTVNKYGHLSNQVRKEIASITDKYI